MRFSEMLGFRPTRLMAAVERAVVAHPNTAATLPGVDGSALEELLERLRRCDADPEALQEFGASLTGREQRGLVSALGIPEEGLGRRICLALYLCLKPSTVGPLWRIWQTVPQVNPATVLLRQGVEEYGGRPAVGPDWAQALQEWVEGDPIPRIVDWAISQGVLLSDLPQLPGEPIAAETPLTHALWRYLLVEGEGSELLREASEVVLQRAQELGPGDHQLFVINYLSNVPHGRWWSRQLESIEARYGLPGSRRRSGRQGFWRRVPEGPRTRFRRYFLDRRLQQALGADEERHRFWHRWLDEINDVELDVAGDVDYAILEFDGFAVVEFFQTGNAAYFYDLPEVDQLRRRSVHNVGDLKVDHGNNRLIHHQNWQSRGTRKVTAWLKGQRW